MNRTINEPILPGVCPARRRELQEAFGRHIVEARNRIAALIRARIEGDEKHPIPLYDRLITRVRRLDPATRADVASVALLAADEIVSAVLTVFAGGNETTVGNVVANYAIIAQLRKSNSHEVLEEIDINRGEPLLVVWDEYKRWLSRYAPSDLRAASGGRASDEPRAD